MGPAGEHGILQLHPTRRCNLRCLHCYSDSSPEQRHELHPGLLMRVLEDAAAEGYVVASFSGGEPLLYDSLSSALDQAHSCGLVTTVVSNGMLLDDRRLEALVGRADLLAISLDGVPRSHNRMRVHRRAFELMSERLDSVRSSGIPFGFIFTLTQHNVNELDWVAQFAQEQGARLLQVHPLENVGRARTLLPGERPDEVESMFAQLEAIRLREETGGRISIQVDIGDLRQIESSPWLVYAGDDPDPESDLSRLVSPLVVETDGTVVPLQHGFARRYALGNVRDASLRRLADDWRKHGLPEFRSLCERVFADLTDDSHRLFVNWYEAIGDRAREELGQGLAT